VFELCADEVAAGGCGAVNGVGGQEIRFFGEWYFGCDGILKTESSGKPNQATCSEEYFLDEMGASLTQILTYPY
jgi:hypothetical protein